jgi:hypothetical protein
MFWSSLSPSDLGRVALTYTGLAILPEVASAVGRGVVSAIEAVTPAGDSQRNYNNPSHLGRHIDTRA